MNSTKQKRQPVRHKLKFTNEDLWGYIFIAAAMIIFCVFASISLSSLTSSWRRWRRSSSASSASFSRSASTSGSVTVLRSA